MNRTIAAISLSALSAVALAAEHTVTLFLTFSMTDGKEFLKVGNDLRDYRIDLSVGQDGIVLVDNGLKCTAAVGDPLVIRNATLTCDDGSWRILSATIIRKHKSENGKPVERWMLERGAMVTPAKL